MNTNFKPHLQFICFSFVGAVMLIASGVQARNVFATTGSSILEYTPGDTAKIAPDFAPTAQNPRAFHRGTLQ